MNKISIGETIFHGYGFAMRRIVANLGLSWLAAVFYAVAAGYWLQAFCTTMLVSPHPGSELNDFALFDLFGFLITTALGSAVIASTLTGAALEPGGETFTAYFAVAKREWILFVALLRFYVFAIAALIAVVFLGGLAIALASPMIGANIQWQGITALSAMHVAVAVVAFAVVATLAVRLGFFAAPVASAETSTSMARSWSLSRGNSWRLFVVAVVLSAPALLLWAVAEWALMGSDLTGAVTTALSPSHNSTAFYQVIEANIAPIASVWALLLVVLNMLFAGASAPAYQTVRDNVTERQSRSMPSAPVLEPAFAGSFAGFAPRYAKEPMASDMGFAAQAEAAPETFMAPPETDVPVMAAELPAETSVLESEAAAEPEVVDAPVMDAQVAQASAVETPIAEPETDVPPAEEITQHPEVPDVHHASEAQVEEANEPLVLADKAHETSAPVMHDEAASAAVAQFPLGADAHSEIPAEHVETAQTEAMVHQPHAETAEIIPLPSHGDERESSQQNAPSEVA